MSYAHSLAILIAFFLGGAMSANADERIESTVAPDAKKDATKEVAETAPATKAATKNDIKGEAVTIPLDSVWSNAVRGAKSLRSLEPEINRSRTPEENEALRKLTPEQIKEHSAKAVEKSLVLQIERADVRVPSKDKEAPPGFAVQGVGHEALRGAHSVLVKGEEPKTKFPARTPVSIVFHSLLTQPSVGIDRIERKGNTITIYYTVRSHGHAVVNWHLSLIPLGELRPGQYDVHVIRSQKNVDQRGFPPVDPSLDRFVVARPFSFDVID